MLLIFDFDGTLVELEDMQNSAYDAVFRHYDIEFDIRAIKPGVSITQKMDMLETLGYSFDREEFQRMRDAWVVNNVGNYLSYSEPLQSSIKQLSRKHVLAIATNAGKEYVMRALDILEISHYFSKINTFTDYPAKPNPEIFLDCMRATGFAKDNTVIFEDSPSGIAAAEKTGATIEITTGVIDTLCKMAKYK